MASTLVKATENQLVVNRDAVLATIADELSKNTRRSYLQAMKSLHAHFDSEGWVLYPLFETGELNEGRYLEQVLSYFQVLNDKGLSYSTLNMALAAVKHFAGYENQRAYSALASKPVKGFFEGLARQRKSHTPKQAQALSIAELKTVYKNLSPSKPREIRDRALIAVGIATALRAQSISDLTLSDVSPALSMDGVVVRVRFSKTDQRGKGTHIPVARSSRRKLDPVAALNNWLSVLAAYGYSKETHPDFPLFPAIRGQRGIQPTPMRHPSLAITEMLRGRLLAAGVCNELQAEAYSSHSLRSTFITLSSAAGVAEKDIAAVSGHVSMSILRKYDRRSVEKAAQTDYLAG